MPDKVRSVDDMVADMERAVKAPEGNTSSAKHRQHVAQAIEKLISSQIIDGKLRYIEDGTGSKAATKTAPALLNVAAAVQEMVSEMSAPHVIVFYGARALPSSVVRHGHRHAASAAITQRTDLRRASPRRRRSTARVDATAPC